MARTACVATVSHQRAGRSVRYEVAAADIDARRLERSVRLLGGSRDGDAGARLELALVADDIGDDLRIRSDDDLLLAILVLEHHDLAVHAGHRGVDRCIGHCGVWPIPRPKA